MKPCRGEIWIVSFDPKTGSEIGKNRPAVVVSVDSIGKLPLRIVTPITDWKTTYENYPWFVCLKPNVTNGLSKLSGADTFQTKSLSIDRFKNKIGNVTLEEINDIADAITLCIGN